MTSFAIGLCVGTVWCAFAYWLGGRLHVMRQRREARRGPHTGSIRRSDGTTIPIHLIPTGKRDVYVTVSQNGDRLSLAPGDALMLDRLYAGQAVQVNWRSEPGDPDFMI